MANFLLPEFDQAFITRKDQTLRLTSGYARSTLKNNQVVYSHHLSKALTYTPNKYNAIVSHPGGNKLEVDFKIPKGTKIVTKNIEIKQRQSGWGSSSPLLNFITLHLFNPLYKGVQFKTVPKITLDVFQKDFKNLRSLEVDPLD